MRSSSTLSFVFLSLLITTPAKSAVSVIQSNSINVSNSGTAVSVSFPRNTTVGNLIAAACLSAATWGKVSVSDRVNFYTSVASYNVNPSLGGVQWFYAESISGGA